MLSQVTEEFLQTKEEGILEVPCVFVDYLTDAQKKPTSLPTTEWQWTQAGMKSYFVLKSRHSRVRTLISVLPDLMRVKSQTFLVLMILRCERR